MLLSIQIFRRNVLKYSARKSDLCSQLSSSYRLLSYVSHPYKFLVGTGFIGKPPETRNNSTKQNSCDISPVKFPHGTDIAKWTSDTMRQGQSDLKDIGEDFFFVQTMKNGSGISFGVADGVGGWSEKGIDPSMFSQALMYHAHRYCKHGWAGEPEVDVAHGFEEREKVEGWELTPQQCLELAHDSVLRDRLVQAGSSTACIIHINASSGLLRSANLGDSGFLILRSSSVVYSQRPQVHYFNCPKQLAKLPSPIRKYRGSCSDLPSEADVHEAHLRDGDIVIAFTDGLSDNVFQAELIKICSLVNRSGVPENLQVQDMADRIVQYARYCMMDRKRVSPFEKLAAREGMYFRGGKVDDVTVLVVMIKENI